MADTGVIGLFPRFEMQEIADRKPALQYAENNGKLGLFPR